jgi:hypothetical protein
MSVVAVWLRGLVLLVFADALLAHIRTSHRLHAVFFDLGLERSLWPAISVALIAADAGVLLLLILVPRVGGLAAVLYLLAVSTALLNAQRHGRRVADCGCGSEPKTLNGSLYSRNAFLCVASVIVAGVAAPPADDPASLVGAGLVLTSVVATRVVRWLALERRAGRPALAMASPPTTIRIEPTS